MTFDNALVALVAFVFGEFAHFVGGFLPDIVGWFVETVVGYILRISLRRSPEQLVFYGRSVFGRAL